jgi:trehalose/maltose transport system permease protein
VRLSSFWRADSARNVLFFLPAAILLGLVVVYPILRTTLLSLFHLKLATQFRAEFAGLENFVRLLFDSRFHDSLKVTGVFTAVSVALEFSIGLLLALAANALIHGKSLVRTILLVPWTLPTAIIAVLWTWIFNDQYGVLNTLLLKTGLTTEAIPWLAGPHTAMAAIIMADVWKTVPFVFLVLLAGLQNVPRELHEAIEMDGGGAWAKFKYVTWPHLLPFVFISIIFRIVQAFAIFDLVYVMTGGGPGGGTETVSLYSYQTYMRYLDFGYGSTLVVATVLILALTAFLLHTFLHRRYERQF